MKEKWTPHIIAVMAFVVFIVLGLACASEPEWKKETASAKMEAPAESSFQKGEAPSNAYTPQSRLNNGKQLFERGNYDWAIRELTEAIKLEPNFAEAYAYRAWSYIGKNDFVLALSDANKSIQLNPSIPFGYNVRGNVYSNNRDFDRAIVEYTEAIKLDPQFSTAYSNRGMAYGHKRDYDHAIADLEAALEINPNNSDAKNALAEVKRLAAKEAANKYDPSKFTVVPSDFKPADYTSTDLFKAASNVRNIRITSNKEEAIYKQAYSWVNLGFESYYLKYVSDLTFVRQNGTDITFSSDDNAITQIMDIDQRSGLQAGQKVRVYYEISRSPLTRWDVVAIERR